MKWKLLIMFFFFTSLHSCSEKKNRVEQRQIAKEIKTSKDNNLDERSIYSVSKRTESDNVALISADSMMNPLLETVKIDDFSTKHHMGEITIAYNAEQHYAPNEFHIFNQQDLVRTVDLNQFSQHQFRRNVTTNEGTNAIFTKDSSEKLSRYFSKREIAIARPWEVDSFKGNFIDEDIHIDRRWIFYKTQICLDHYQKNDENDPASYCRTIVTKFDLQGETIYKDRIIPLGSPVFSPSGNFSISIYSSQGKDQFYNCFCVFDLGHEKKVLQTCSPNNSRANAGWLEEGLLTYSFSGDTKSIENNFTKLYTYQISNEITDTIKTNKKYYYYKNGTWFHHNENENPITLK